VVHGFADGDVGNSAIHATVASERPLRSLAVLAFANVGADRADDYLGDSVAEQLTTGLGTVRGLRVVARTSAFAYKARSSDIREIGRALGVDHVLEGSIRRVDTRLRVAARLIDAQDGCRVWSAEYDRFTAEPAAVQDGIASQIVAALRLRVAVRAPRRDDVSGARGLGASERHAEAGERRP